MAKKEKPEIPDLEEVIADDVLEVIPLVEPVAGEAVPPGPGAKRSMGAKEPIPFKWKIIGSSGRFILTLFKSVEREDADAQIERLQKDGYYTNLRVVDINEKIEQPPSPKESKKSIAKPDKFEKSAKSDRTPEKAEPPRKASAPLEKPIKAMKATAAPLKATAGKKAPAKLVERPAASKSKSAVKKPVASKGAKVSGKKK